jgi:hypothetical protein
MIRVNRKLVADLGKFVEMRYGIDLTDPSHPPELIQNLLRFQYWMDEALLTKYFQDVENAEEEGVYWQQQLQYEHRRSGKRLEDRLKAMPNASILDVGCGDNAWKEILGDRVHGIDPFNSKADTMKSILDFKTDNQWQVVLALGSINFGDEKTIFEQVKRVTELVAPGGLIIWRFNPGITHDNTHAKWIDFFDWSHEKVEEMCKELKRFEIDILDWEHENEENIRWGNRIYSEWRRVI